MKKYIYIIIIFGLGWLIFADKIMAIFNHLFISSVIPYSWKITRILLGIIVASSIILSMIFAGSLFGNLMAFVCSIPALIAAYWLACDVFGFLNWKEFNFDLRLWGRIPMFS